MYAQNPREWIQVLADYLEKEANVHNRQLAYMQKVLDRLCVMTLSHAFFCRELTHKPRFTNSQADVSRLDSRVLEVFFDMNLWTTVFDGPALEFSRQFILHRREKKVHTTAAVRDRTKWVVRVLSAHCARS